MVSGWFEAIEHYLEYSFAVMAPELSTFIFQFWVESKVDGGIFLGVKSKQLE